MVVLVIISAFFSASEIGIMSLNRYRLRHLVKKKNKQAKRVHTLLMRPEQLLSVILIGNTLANIISSMAGTLIGQRLYGDTGVLIATTILTLVVLVFAEMMPKTLAALFPQKVAFACSFMLVALLKILSPLIYAVSSITNGLLKLCGVHTDKAQKDHLTGEELRSVVVDTGSLLPVEHRSMLLSLLDLERTRVTEIMVPKADIVGIDIEEPWHKILEKLETAQHTRMPLYRQNIDHLVGMIHLRSVLNLSLEKDLNIDHLIEIMEDPYFVPEHTPLHTQILNFRKMKCRSCFVVDEYGELQGLVTLEDILEEVIGEFTTDFAAIGKEIAFDQDGSVIIDASITLRNLNRLLNWNLPSLGPRTLSGLIVEHLGYIPAAKSCLKINTYQIEILKISGNTIKSVRMLKVHKKTSPSRRTERGV